MTSGYTIFACQIKPSLTKEELTEPRMSPDGKVAIGFAGAVAARWRALTAEERQEWNDKSDACQKAVKLPGWERNGTFYINRELGIVVGAPPYSREEGMKRIKAAAKRQIKRKRLEPGAEGACKE